MEIFILKTTTKKILSKTRSQNVRDADVVLAADIGLQDAHHEQAERDHVGQASLRQRPGEVGLRRVAGGHHAQRPRGAPAAAQDRRRGHGEDDENDRDRVEAGRGAAQQRVGRRGHRQREGLAGPGPQGRVRSGAGRRFAGTRGGQGRPRHHQAERHRHRQVDEQPAAGRARRHGRRVRAQGHSAREDQRSGQAGPEDTRLLGAVQEAARRHELSQGPHRLRQGQPEPGGRAQDQEGVLDQRRVRAESSGAGVVGRRGPVQVGHGHGQVRRDQEDRGAQGGRSGPCPGGAGRAQSSTRREAGAAARGRVAPRRPASGLPGHDGQEEPLGEGGGLVRQEAGASAEADRRPGRREDALDAGGRRLAEHLRQPARRRAHLVGRHRLPGRLHGHVPRPVRARLDHVQQGEERGVQRSVQVLAVGRARRADQDPAVEHQRPAQGRLQHRQRRHRVQLEALAAHDRSAGPGQPLDQELREGQQAGHHQDDRLGHDAHARE